MFAKERAKGILRPIEALQLGLRARQLHFDMRL
jgi:hypothetical protein